ncbi:hypothetical protein B0O80DRAFT_496071 [Mortierella sp. GBAus27b]|nr:hypothetical protein BGX31_011251 [Mortierella sp. GBA43]KAI8358313.1 hypothetical protein B0O80DRAFT_496071 [Mortierella sp. GBAus27b]
MSRVQHKGSETEEEEEDYMSEAFLNKLVEESGNTKKDNMTYSEKRRQKEREHQANLPKPLRVREKEARDKGLETEIGEENKGMAMLLKMGFQKGGTLGAPKPSDNAGSTSSSAGSSSLRQTLSSDSDRPSALRAPIAIQMKQGRGGIGMESVRKRKAEEESQRKEDQDRQVYDEGYRGQKGDAFQLDKRKRQLEAARAICMRMDAKKAESRANQSGEARYGNLGRSNTFWWIADAVPDVILGTSMMGPGAEVVLDEGERDFEQDSGAQSPDDDQHQESREQKRIKLDPLEPEDEESEQEPPKWGERPEFASLEVPEKLGKVVSYLRLEHHYCFWCAAQYYGLEDLAENCPGDAEDDH